MSVSAPGRAVNAAIPFQESGGLGLDTLVLALAITVAVLAVFALAAFWGRKKGWWGAGRDQNASSTRAFVEEVIPLSRSTQMIVVRSSNRRWVIFESSKHLSVHSEDVGNLETKT